MTIEEVIKELKVCDFYVTGRIPGLSIKNKDKISSRNYKNGDIMSISHYTEPKTNNKVWVYSTKAIYQSNGKEYGSLYVSCYYLTNYGTYIIPILNGVELLTGYFEFTSHAVARLKQRLGKGFETFFAEDYLSKNNTYTHLTKYDYGDEDNIFICRIGDAFLICSCSEGRVLVKTILSKDELHSNQLEDMLDSKVGGEKFEKRCEAFADGFVGAQRKELLRAGVIRRM